MQKTTRLQRLLAVVVAVFMAVCCLPLNAFADGNVKTCTYYVTQLDQNGNVIEGGAQNKEVSFTLDFDGNLPNLVAVPALKDYFTAQGGYKLSRVTINDVEKEDISTCYPVHSQPQNLVIYFDAPETAEPDHEANYTIKFVDENGKSVAESMNLNITWKGETGPNLMNYLRENGAIKSIDGFTYAYVCAAGGSEENKYAEDSQAVVVPGGPYELEVHYTTNAPVFCEAAYKINFIDENGEAIQPSTTFRPSWVEGEQHFLLTELKTTLQAVVDKGYTFNKVCYVGSEEAIPENNLVVEGNYEVNAYFTKNVEPSKDREAVYTVNFVDENGNKIQEPVNVNMSWVDGQELYVLAQLDGTLKSVEGYTFQNLTAYNGTEPYDGDELVVEGNYSLTAHYTKIDLDRDTTYKINFVDQNNNIIRDPAVVTIGWVDGQDLYVLAQLESTLNGVEGNYSFDKLTAWNGTEAISDTVKVVPGSYELTAHYILGGKDCNSKYTIHFVDENNNEFKDPTVVNMAWVEGQDLNLMTQLDSTLKNVEGYTFKSLTAWNGTEAYKGDEKVVPGEYELIAHYTKKATSSSSDNNTTTVSSNNNKTNNTEVVKAAAPADNTAKVMPQTGLTAETPVVFGIMMVAALAGAGAYLFAIRKKLN